MKQITIELAYFFMNHQLVSITISFILAYGFLVTRDILLSKLKCRREGSQDLYYVFNARGGEEQVTGIQGIIFYNMKLILPMYCILLVLFHFNHK